MNPAIFQVYNNILIFAKKYRKWNVVSKLMENESDCVKLIEKMGYIMIECNDGKKRSFIMVLSSESPYLKTKEFNRVPAMITKKPKEKVDLFLITENVVTTHIIKKMASFKLEHRIKCYNYQHAIFLQIMPEARNQAIPEFTIYRGDDIQKKLDENMMQGITQCGIIKHYDTQMIWIGARPGDLIEIIGASENSGKRIALKRVV
jgi:DNA-directed RNA polymerase subunit H (RpoH/RPB5)